ncbi:MAG: hypothetical protein C4305_07260 [Thermoleophilia bacterium]
MQCPVDGTALAMAERHGVEIDYCPQCRGVWLDRGELDKIIAQAEPPAQDRERYDDEEDDGEQGGRRGGKRRRLSGFFEGFGD